MKKYQYDETHTSDKEEYKSRSQKKRESTAKQEDAEKLLKLSSAQLKDFIESENLSPELVEAIEEYKKISSKEAKRRQMQYIGKLMRQ